MSKRQKVKPSKAGNRQMPKRCRRFQYAHLKEIFYLSQELEEYDRRLSGKKGEEMVMVNASAFDELQHAVIIAEANVVARRGDC